MSTIEACKKADLFEMLHWPEKRGLVHCIPVKCNHVPYYQGSGLVASEILTYRPIPIGSVLHVYHNPHDLLYYNRLACSVVNEEILVVRKMQTK